MTGKQIVKEISRIRKKIANLVKHVNDPTEKALIASAATDGVAYRVLLNQAPLSVRK